MRIRVLGAGWYGCHLGLALSESGHEVEVHELADHIFAGASGSIPARLHLGFHYPRSRITRAACQEHVEAFMSRYGMLTAGVPVNIYAIASGHSLVDFDQYVRTLRGEVDFITIDRPHEFGLTNVDGAVLTGERHILTNLARRFFEAELADEIRLNTEPGKLDDPDWDWTIDCTFGARDAAGVDRYEPCLVLLMKGPTDRAVTVMDGPFASLYPWDEELGLCSLSSALWTPFSKTCRTWAAANEIIQHLSAVDVEVRAAAMIEAMAEHYPAIRDFSIEKYGLSIRAMPLSGADTRLVDVARAGENALRVRAGKIDAIIHAEREIKRIIGA